MQRGTMMRQLILTPLIVLAACQTTPAPHLASAGTIAPAQAIQAAASVAPRVPGVFEIHVVASGRQSGNIYLNSEKDYRDQRNLTIAIHPRAFDGLRARFGGDPDAALAGMIIRVAGEARRVTIVFIDNGRPASKYYYQTHVDVVRADQIQIVG
jgi:hypothetical protein